MIATTLVVIVITRAQVRKAGQENRDKSRQEYPQSHERDIKMLVSETIEAELQRDVGPEHDPQKELGR